MGRTPFWKKEETARRWWVVDAEGKTLGRLATSLAMILSGKDKPNWTPHVDNGDFVVVVNAKRIRVSGKKEEDKLYQWHTGYPGGIKKMSLAELREKHPERIVEWAVQGMLPKSKLGKAMIRKLKVYAGADHPHEAQQPETLAL